MSVSGLPGEPALDEAWTRADRRVQGDVSTKAGADAILEQVEARVNSVSAIAHAMRHDPALKSAAGHGRQLCRYLNTFQAAK